MTAPTSARAPSSSAAALISRCICRHRAFIGGRCRRIVATPSLDLDRDEFRHRAPAFLRSRGTGPRALAAERSGAPSGRRHRAVPCAGDRPRLNRVGPARRDPDRHGGANVAIWAQGATAVDLCLFDEAGREERDPADRARLQRLPPAPRRPARRHALRLPGPRRLEPGRSATAGTRTSCCSTPTPRPSTGPSG